jgi:hypothetical protein
MRMSLLRVYAKLIELHLEEHQRAHAAPPPTSIAEAPGSLKGRQPRWHSISPRLRVWLSGCMPWVLLRAHAWCLLVRTLSRLRKCGREAVAYMPGTEGHAGRRD